MRHSALGESEGLLELCAGDQKIKCLLCIIAHTAVTDKSKLMIWMFAYILSPGIISLPETNPTYFPPSFTPTFRDAWFLVYAEDTFPSEFMELALQPGELSIKGREHPGKPADSKRVAEDFLVKGAENFFSERRVRVVLEFPPLVKRPKWR